MQMKSKARVPVEIALFAGTLALITPVVKATAQVAPAAPSRVALMPLPSSITYGEGALLVTPDGGGGSTFIYRSAPTHAVCLDASVKRSMMPQARSCAEYTLRSPLTHTTPSI